MSARSPLPLSAIVLALAGCAADVGDGLASAALTDGPVCGALTDALVSEAGADVGSVDITNDHDSLDFALTATAPIARVRIYAGLPPSDGGPVPFRFVGGTYDLIMDDLDATLDPAATSASFELPWSELALACGARVKVMVKVFFADGTIAWANSASPYQYYENVHWDYYTACAESCEPPPPPTGCTLTQGFWKTHPEAWPVDSLALGSVVYSKSALLAFLWTPPRGGDQSLILVHQLIAAKLNAATGALAPTATIAAADAWIAAQQAAGRTLPFGKLKNAGAAVDLAAALDAYNNGFGETPHCD